MEGRDVGRTDQPTNVPNSVTSTSPHLYTRKLHDELGELDREAVVLLSWTGTSISVTFRKQLPKAASSETTEKSRMVASLLNRSMDKPKGLRAGIFFGRGVVGVGGFLDGVRSFYFPKKNFPCQVSDAVSDASICSQTDARFAYTPNRVGFLP